MAGMASSRIIYAFALAWEGTGSFSEVRQPYLILMERGGGRAQMIMAKWVTYAMTWEMA